MKKILVLIVLMFAFAYTANAGVGDAVEATGKVLANGVDTVYHDAKSVVSTVYSDAKGFASTIYPDVKEAVKEIGAAIGVAAEHVYGVLVKKYIVLGVKELLFCLFGLILLIVGYFNWKKSTGPDKLFTYRCLVPIAFIITGIVVMTKVDYDTMLMGLINPEYGAINYILEFTKDVIK